MIMTLEQAKQMEEFSYLKFVKFEDGTFVFLEIYDYHSDALKVKPNVKPINAGTIKFKINDRFYVDDYRSTSIQAITGKPCFATDEVINEVAVMLDRKEVGKWED